MRKTLIALGAAALLLTGCSDGSDNSSGKSSDNSGSGVTVNIDIQGDEVTPNGDRIKVKIGEPITLKINSDREGEMHVHSTPEQQIEYTKGTTLDKFTIDTPGIIDVEDHVTDVVVVQLEVS